jgi:DNA-binding winged helix-turn-helix (wHTH) protein
MPTNTPCLRFGLFQLDPAERLLLRGDREIHLASKLFETLLFLVQNAGHLVEKETLMRSVWKGTFVEEGSLAHSISVLRKILGDGTERNRYIETVPRHGYRFIAPLELLTAQGRFRHFQRRYDDAIECHRRALAIDPNFVEAHFNLAMVYEQKLLFRDAISQFRKVNRLAGARASFWSAGLGHAYGLAGMKKPARNILNQLLIATSPVSQVSTFDIAWVYLGLGEKDATLAWMDKAFADRCSPLVYQNMEPALDPLRAEPQFRNLLHRMKLSH